MSQVPTEIHSLVQDPDHLDMTRTLQIEDDMTADRTAPIPLADFLPNTPAVRVPRKALDHRLDLTDVFLRLTDVPAILGEVPDR